VNKQSVLYVLYRMCGERCLTQYELQCHSAPLLLEIGQTIKTGIHRVLGWLNELRVVCEVWSTEICKVSFSNNLREKSRKTKIRLGKV